jgi:hypothetical protein
MMTQAEGRTMPKVTLYVKDAYADIWERARKLTDDSEESLSTLVSEALKAAVEQREAAQREAEEVRNVIEELKARMEPVEVEVDEPRKQVVRFTGTLLASSPDPEEEIYMTRGGKIIVFGQLADGSNSYYIFDSIEDLKEATDNDRVRLSQEMISEAFETLGKPFVVEIE